MAYKNRKAKWRKNWKIWAVTLLMALTLVGRGAGALVRSSHKTPTPSPTVAATPTNTPVITGTVVIQPK